MKTPATELLHHADPWARTILREARSWEQAGMEDRVRTGAMR